jgi:asparagine synthase (glutamine-hydrolysing)
VRPAREQWSIARARIRGVPFDIGQLINPAFAARLDLARRADDEGWLMRLAIGSPRDLRFGVMAPGISPAGAGWHHYGANAGFDARDPTADVRVISFCYRLPDELFARPEADRWLMRRAMEGILPPDVQWNTQRGRQSGDLAYRLRADAAVSTAVAAIAASPHCREYVNVAQVERWWRSVADPGERHPSEAAVLLVCALSIGLFLTRFDD